MMTNTAPAQTKSVWTKEDLFQRLARATEFERLTNALLTDLVKISVQRRYARNATIICEQEPVDGFYIIESGYVKVVRHTSTGGEHIVNFFHGKDSFNLVPTLDKGLNHATVIALTDTIVWQFPMAKLRPLMAYNPRLVEVFAQITTRRMRDLLLLREELAVAPVRERIASFLLRHMLFVEKSVPRFFTYDELANHLGTESEVLNSQLGKLESENIIEIASENIMIQDKLSLQRIANRTVI